MDCVSFMLQNFYKIVVLCLLWINAMQANVVKRSYLDQSVRGYLTEVSQILMNCGRENNINCCVMILAENLPQFFLNCTNRFWWEICSLYIHDDGNGGQDLDLSFKWLIWYLECLIYRSISRESSTQISSLYIHKYSYTHSLQLLDDKEK